MALVRKDPFELPPLGVVDLAVVPVVQRAVLGASPHEEGLRPDVVQRQLPRLLDPFDDLGYNAVLSDSEEPIPACQVSRVHDRRCIDHLVVWLPASQATSSCTARAERARCADTRRSERSERDSL